MNGTIEWPSSNCSAGIYLVHIIVTGRFKVADPGEIIMKKGDSTIKKFAVIR
ncbi:MAG: hypothetical protein CM15mP53_06140 [Ectothiorhodospiraceae bacterium]|nr:MAG: hypothetical protein CM15mP53_06140 [Ectothiorhodospiraceae bacterium]